MSKTMSKLWKKLPQPVRFYALTLAGMWLSVLGLGALVWGVCLFSLPLGVILGGFCAILLDRGVDTVMTKGGRR